VGTLAVLAGLCLVIVAAAVPASIVARGSVIAFLLAIWVIGFALVVSVSVLLSLVHGFTRPMLLVAFAIVCVASVGHAAFHGVRPPQLRPALAVARDALRDPVLATLAVTGLVAYGYQTALTLFTAPNEDDAVTYHLLRAAFWKQEHAIGWIAGPVDLRANVSPPVAEIGVAVTMVLDQGERFVAAPQLLAVPASALATLGLARRVGLDPRAATFGALCVGLLPLVLLQASTAMNDVVPAAFAAVATYFVLRERALDLALGALAIVLLLGTKTAGLLVVPAIALVTALGQPRRRWAFCAGIGMAAILVGSAWYVVNRVETGSWSGGLASVQGSTDGLDPVPPVARFLRYLTNAVEVSGAGGADRWLYPLVGVVLVGAALVARRRDLGIAGALVAAVPLLLPFRHALDEGYKRLFWKLGRRELTRLGNGDRDTIASTAYTWYGPVGLLLSAAALALVIREVRRRSLPPVAVALALAPLVALATMAVALAWNGVYGRLIMGGVVIGAATWGVAFRYRAVSIAVAATSAVLAVTSLVWSTQKPLGVRLLEPARASSAWTDTRWDLQEFEDGTAPFLGLVETTVPADARVAVASALPPYTFFGPHLSREVHVIERGAATVPGDWLVLDAGTSPACAAAWAPVGNAVAGHILFRRVGPDCGSRG
jgi:hypothetical protein